MEVDKLSFYPLLPDILTDISEAHFVTIDLELSGIPTKVARNHGKATLQERYLETKDAAERYQILQIGITCVQQDIDNAKYILKPYNFDISPIIAERGLDIERIFSYQSGAAEFLLKVGFDMARPFTHGVPYLSRLEARQARANHIKRQDRTAIGDIQIKPTETESLAFLDRVRTLVGDWVTSTRMDTPEYVNISPLSADLLAGGDAPEELSRFEKRLVHQLVRAEFPELISISRRGFVQVQRLDVEHEEKVAAQRKRDSDERIGRQKGFRWVMEALLGNDLSKLDLRECARDPVTGEVHGFADLDDLRAQFHRAHNLLRHHPRMLVGHNCFLDLVYIYRTFIGVLPNTVTEFQKKLHALWPSIVDTKYMSTHNCGDISPASSLEQIAGQLSLQKVPVVELDSLHSTYEKREAFHEAGYDSFMTAQIAVRLSSKLEKEGAYVEDPENGKSVDKVTNGINGLAISSHSAPNNDSTTGAAVEGSFTPSDPALRWKRRGDPTVASTPSTSPNSVDVFLQAAAQQERGMDGGMPKLGGDFWRVYGNKLRIFGTEEGVCLLDHEGLNAAGKESEDSEGGVGGGGVSI